MTQKNRFKQPPGFLFWFWWTLATACAWSLFFELFSRLSDLLYPVFYPYGIRWGDMLWIAGLLLGLLQWPVLHRHIPHAYRWIAANVLGLLPGSAYLFLSKVWKAPILLFIAGVGLLQWLVLRRSIRRAGLWLLAEAVILFFVVILGALSYGRAVIATGLLFGGLTGAVLVWLLRGSAVDSTQRDGLRESPRFLNFISLAMLFLAVAPLYAAWQTYSFQKHVYCERLKIGTLREEIHPHVGKPGPLPPELQGYSEEYLTFARYWHSNRFDEPGLGFDTDDRVALVTRIRSEKYYLVECPWTFADYIKTLP
jgi:hypothetical protein